MSDSSQTTADFRITARAALEAAKAGALVVDVRGEAGRNRNGELQGAVVIAKPDVVEALTRRIGRTSSTQKVVLFCGSVAGSEPLVRALRGAGEDNVFDVEGGFSALIAEGALPIARDAAPVG